MPPLSARRSTLHCERSARFVDPSAPTKIAAAVRRSHECANLHHPCTFKTRARLHGLSRTPRADPPLGYWRSSAKKGPLAWPPVQSLLGNLLIGLVRFGCCRRDHGASLLLGDPEGLHQGPDRCVDRVLGLAARFEYVGQHVHALEGL